MKKLFLLTLSAMIIAGVYEVNAYNKEQTKLVSDYHPSTIEYGGCEYVVLQSYFKRHATMTHKGNCRFCAKRRRQELQSIVEQLKEK